MEVLINCCKYYLVKHLSLFAADEDEAESQAWGTAGEHDDTFEVL